VTRKRIWLLAGAGVLATVLLVIVVALATMDRWLFTLLDPGPFDPAATPPAPDYAQASSWAALPELDDGADVALPEHPAIDQRTAPAAVFFLHPTTALGDKWNAAFDDPAVIEATTRGATLIQASAFNACCGVYAPRYRQANGRAFLFPDANGQQALDVAYADVSAAFDEFLARIGERPFIIAGHSQGAVLGTRLVRERISGSPLHERMIAAYLPGAPIRAGNLGDVPVCAEPTQTGCAVSWHARSPAFVPNAFEFEHQRAQTMQGRVCVNPISWSTASDHVPAERSAGALFFDSAAPQVKPAFADAQCRDGTLLVTQMGDPERDLPSKLLLWVMGPGDYHPIEYQMYYLDIRANAAERVQVYLSRRPPR
jgi:hypothetical protein